MVNQEHFQNCACWACRERRTGVPQDDASSTAQVNRIVTILSGETAKSIGLAPLELRENTITSAAYDHLTYRLTKFDAAKIISAYYDGKTEELARLLQEHGVADAMERAQGV